MKRQKELRDHQIHFRMTDEDMQELDMASYLEDMTRSEYVRRALHFYFNLRKYAPEIIEELEKEMSDKYE